MPFVDTALGGLARRIDGSLPRFSCRVWKHLSAAIGVRYAPPYNTLLELGIPLFPSRAESCDFAVEVLSGSGRTLNEQQMTLFWQAARLVDADLQELSREMWLEICADLGGGGDEIDALSLDRLVSEWHPQYFVEVVNMLWSVDYLRHTFLRVDSYAVGDASTVGSSDRSCHPDEVIVDMIEITV